MLYLLHKLSKYRADEENDGKLCSIVANLRCLPIIMFSLFTFQEELFFGI